MGRYFKTATLNMFDDFYSDPWKDINAKLVEKQTAFDTLSQHKDLLAKQLEQFKVLRDDGIDGELLRRANEYSLNKAQELQDYLIETGDVDTVTREATNLGKEINSLYTTGDLGKAIQGKIFHDEMLKKNEEMFKGDPGAGDRYKAYWMNEYYKNGGKFAGSTLGGMFELINFPEFGEMEEFAVKVLKESGWNNIRKSDNGELEVETENGWEGVTSKRFQDLIFNRLYNEPKYRRAIEQREMMGMKKEDFLRGYFNMAGYLAYGKDKSKHSTAIGDVAEHREKGKIDLANSKDLHQYKETFKSDPKNLTIKEKLDILEQTKNVHGENSPQYKNMESNLFGNGTDEVYGDYKVSTGSIYDKAKNGDRANMTEVINHTNRDLLQKYAEATGIPVEKMSAKEREEIGRKINEISVKSFYRTKHNNLEGYLKAVQQNFDTFVGSLDKNYKKGGHISTKGYHFSFFGDNNKTSEGYKGGKGNNMAVTWGGLTSILGKDQEATGDTNFISINPQSSRTAVANIKASHGQYEYFDKESDKWLTIDEATSFDNVNGINPTGNLLKGTINGKDVVIRGNKEHPSSINIVNSVYKNNTEKGTPFHILQTNPQIANAVEELQKLQIHRSNLPNYSNTPLYGESSYNNHKLVAYKGEYYLIHKNDISNAERQGLKNEALGEHIKRYGSLASNIYEASVGLTKVQ